MSVSTKDDTKSLQFIDANMADAKISNVNLESALFENICLRGSSFSAIDFGGAKFSCMNTGEDKKRKPAIFTSVEFHHCIFDDCVFTGAKFSECEVKGMTIDGIAVEDLINTYRKEKGGMKNNRSFIKKILGRWLRC